MFLCHLTLWDRRTNAYLHWLEYCTSFHTFPKNNSWQKYFYPNKFKEKKLTEQCWLSTTLSSTCLRESWRGPFICIWPQPVATQLMPLKVSFLVSSENGKQIGVRFKISGSHGIFINAETNARIVISMIYCTCRYYYVSNKGTCTPIYFWSKIHPICPYQILYGY